MRAKYFLSGLWVEEGTGLGRFLDSQGQRILQQEIRELRLDPQGPFQPRAAELGSRVCGSDFFQTALGKPNSTDLCQTNNNNNDNEKKKKEVKKIPKIPCGCRVTASLWS